MSEQVSGEMVGREWPRVAADEIAWITTDQMVEVDRVMMEDLGIGLIQMMENAGRNLARLATSLWRPNTAVVCVGSGGNGGGGMVAARHLHNMGVAVRVLSTRRASELRGVPAHQATILERMGVELESGSGPSNVVDAPDLMLDAVLGYSLKGAPAGRALELLEFMDSAGAPVLALDVPSGVDTTTGQSPGAVVSAAATLTLAMPKQGLRAHGATGRLFVGDISVPPQVYALASVAADGDVEGLFADAPIVEVIDDDLIATGHR